AAAMVGRLLMVAPTGDRTSGGFVSATPREEGPHGGTMLEVMLATVGVLAVGVGATSKLLREIPVSPPLLALLAGVLIGPAVLDAVEIPLSQQPGIMETASRLLLAVALMA